MSIAEQARKKAAALRSTDPKLASKPAAKSNGRKVFHQTRGDVPWAAIKRLYERGKTTAEISDELGLTKNKTSDGKHKNPYPYYLTVGYLTRLSHGVEVDGQKMSIKRGGKRGK